MKYPCKMIQDLLPLYLDGVCSEESKEAVEQHLQECPDCRQFFSAMREAELPEPDAPALDLERKKAASFQSVKKKIFRRQILVVIIVLAILTVLAVTAFSVLKSSTEIVEYKDNVSVSMVDGDLIGRLQGSEASYVKIKRITGSANGQEKNYLFFYLSDTKWASLTTNPQVFSEYVLCPADKGADQIDAVYYFSGIYTDLESMSDEELQEVIAASELLWSK